MAKLDEKLTRLLADASPKSAADIRSEAIEIVLIFNQPHSDRDCSPDETRSVADGLMSRVEGLTNQRAEKVQVFSNLHSMAVRARADFLTTLVEQPEVASALLNESG